jgi:hypothetical protein
LHSSHKKDAQKSREQRRPYQAPRVVAVDLKSDEVLAANCKHGQFPNPLGATCMQNSCSIVGS